MNYYEFIKENSQYKKYLVWKFISSYGIFEIIEVKENGLIVNKLFDNSKFIDDSNWFTITKTAFKRQAVFQSDNLQECIEQLSILDKAKKYNL